jgi:hypothetical protein
VSHQMASSLIGIRPSGAAVVENYYVAHLACCLMPYVYAMSNEILCSKRLRGSPVTEQTKSRCERPFATSSPLCLPTWWLLLGGLFSRRRLADSHVALSLCRDGEGRFVFSAGPHSSYKARGHTSCIMQKRRRSLSMAVAACARAVGSWSTSEIAAKAPCGQSGPVVDRGQGIKDTSVSWTPSRGLMLWRRGLRGGCSVRSAFPTIQR